MRKTLQSYLPSVFGKAKASKLPPSVLKEIKAKQAKAKSKMQTNAAVPVAPPAKNDAPAVDVKQPPVPVAVGSTFVDTAGRLIGTKCDENSLMDCNDDNFIAIMNKYGFTQVDNSRCVEPDVFMSPEEYCNDGESGYDDAYIALRQCDTVNQTISGQTMNSIRTEIWLECTSLVNAQRVAEINRGVGIFLGVIGGVFFLIATICYFKDRKCECRIGGRIQSDSAQARLLINAVPTTNYSSVAVQPAEPRAGAESAAANSADPAPTVAAFSIASS